MTEDLLTIEFDNNQLLNLLIGNNDEHIKRIEEALNISISLRGSKLFISGSDRNSQKAQKIIEELYDKLRAGFSVTMVEVESLIKNYSTNTKDKKISKYSNKPELIIKTKKKSIIPLNDSQKEYILNLKAKDIVFATGPAGTGKTYLAVAYAISEFFDRKFERIVLTRPAIEAGEKIGFLPGDLKEKIDPYLRPIYDALYDMVPHEIINRFIETGEIEIAPMAFMRGRTLNNAFIILDEAQNTTRAQMKMFLTRMGSSSKMVITGDPTQTDLQADELSGLEDAVKILDHIKEIGFSHFTTKDTVRHKLTAKILNAYKDLKN